MRSADPGRNRIIATIETARSAIGPRPVRPGREIRPMARLARSGLIALMVAALVTVAGAQTPPAGPAAPRAAQPAAAKGPSPKQVLASVNGEPITRGEVIDFMRQYGFS